ncbi:MAG: zinc ribbon domain-containing protein, partial [Verrucomicrobiota bacterium]
GVMEGKMVGLCAAEVPGDTQRGLRVSSDYSGQTFKHLLVPVWVLAYTYGSGSFQVIVNGYTGAIAGKHPLSWGKIFLVGLVGLVVLTMILYVASKQNS